MGFQKIFDEFEVSSIYTSQSIIDKNKQQEEIDKYIHTNEDIDLCDMYTPTHSNLNGFYAIDGSTYRELLSFYQRADGQQAEAFVKEFKNKYPSLSQTKKTKKLIFQPIEKMFFGDLSCYKNFLKEIETKSLFFDTAENNLINKYKEAYQDAYDNNDFLPIGANYFQIYANFNNDNIAEEFLTFNSTQNDTTSMLGFLNSNTPMKNSSQIEISNNQIRFFVPEDFNSSKTPFSNQLGHEVKKFEEKLINCKNGVYEINLYKDEVFNKNLETKKILDEKIQTLVKKSQDEETEIDKEYDYERDGSDSYEEKLSALDRILEAEVKLARLENPITELGNYFYHIKLI